MIGPTKDQAESIEYLFKSTNPHARNIVDFLENNLKHHLDGLTQFHDNDSYMNFNSGYAKCLKELYDLFNYKK